MLINKPNRLIKLTDTLVRVIKKSKLPIYSCSKSKHTYKQYQLAVMWCLMKHLKTNYRSIINLLDLIPKIKQLIGLNQLPHFTTTNKFFLRINQSLLNNFLVQTVNLFNLDNCCIAIDSSGYSSNYASRYYVNVVRISMRTYVKKSIAVDTTNQVIVSYKARKGPRHDCLDFGYLLTNASKCVNIGWVVGDKAYDSEANRALVIEQLSAKPIIPIKQHKFGDTVHGRYRRKNNQYFDEKLYHKRSIVETINSVMKRIFGSWLQSRSLVNRIKEVGMMCVCYNIHRYVVNYLVLWMFSTEPSNRKAFIVRVFVYHLVNLLGFVSLYPMGYKPKD